MNEYQTMNQFEEQIVLVPHDYAGEAADAMVIQKKVIQDDLYSSNLTSTTTLDKSEWKMENCKANFIDDGDE